MVCRLKMSARGKNERVCWFLFFRIFGVAVDNRWELQIFVEFFYFNFTQRKVMLAEITYNFYLHLGWMQEELSLLISSYIHSERSYTLLEIYCEYDFYSSHYIQ